MENHKYNEALFLFKKNAKTYSSHKTLNNLGVFLLECASMGLDHEQCIRDGRNYLLKAIAEKDNYFSEVELADSYFKSKEYREAIKHYIKALEIKNTVVVLNNLALTYFELGNLRKSELLLEVANNKTKQKNKNVSKFYIFVLAELGQREKTMRLIKAYSDINDCSNDMDIFYLSFYTENYDMIIENYSDVMKDNMLECDFCKVVKYILLSLYFLK